MEALASEWRQRMNKMYEISGKFQQEGSWSELPEDFRGVFVVDEDTQVLKGYMEDKYESPYDPIRFVCGIMDGTHLGYFKLSNDWRLAPLVYVFKDYHEDGMWGGVGPLMGEVFMQGKAKVTLKEVTEGVQKQEKEIEEMYSLMRGGFMSFNKSVEKFLPDLRHWLETLS